MKKNTVSMPIELTYENGAKAALMNEFKINVPMVCHACYNGPQNDCEICGGKGEYTQQINVPWTTIKEIYKAAVNLLGH